MDLQAEIARLQAEATEHQQRFMELMQGLATGASTADEVCAAFRAFGEAQIELGEVRIRAVSGVLQDVGHLGGLTGMLGFDDIPTVG